MVHEKGPQGGERCSKPKVGIAALAIFAISACTVLEQGKATILETCNFNTNSTVEPGEAVYVFDGVVFVERQKRPTDFIDRPIITFNRQGWVDSIAYVRKTKEDAGTTAVLGHLSMQDVAGAMWFAKVGHEQRADECLDATPPDKRRKQFTLISVAKGVGYKKLFDEEDYISQPLILDGTGVLNGALHVVPPPRIDVKDTLLNYHYPIPALGIL